jgi:purine-binding chemotaxis protein CheW
LGEARGECKHGEHTVKEGRHMTEQLVVFFELASEHYAIDSMGVREIIRMQAITKIPGAPGSVLGVINLRGKVTPVLDLRKRLGLLANGESQETRIMVVEVEGQYVGLVVDGVSEVSRIPSSAVEATSTIVAAEEADYILGVAKLEKKLVILLDIGRLLVGGEKRSPPGAVKNEGRAIASMA